MILNWLLSGAITMASLVIALFFLRFWRRTGDFFFVYFALAFALEGLVRLWPALVPDGEGSPVVYLIRLLSYALILVAVVRKNRQAAGRTPKGPDVPGAARPVRSGSDAATPQA